MDKNNNPLINIENLHIHMDERMDSMNFYHPEKDGSDCCDDCFDCECRDCPGHPGCCCPGGDDEVEIDMDELVKEIQKETHLPAVIIERVLAAESKILARLGVATEVHVADETDDYAADADNSSADRTHDPESGCKYEDKPHTPDVEEMKAKVFPVLAGMAMIGLIRAIHEAEKNEKEEKDGSNE